MPKSKDEAKKLYKKFKHGKLGHDPSAETRSDVITRKFVCVGERKWKGKEGGREGKRGRGRRERKERR